MRILVATDAWRPQINGVVHSLEQTAIAARRKMNAVIRRDLKRSCRWRKLLAAFVCRRFSSDDWNGLRLCFCRDAIPANRRKAAGASAERSISLIR